MSRKKKIMSSLTKRSTMPQPQEINKKKEGEREREREREREKRQMHSDAKC